MTNPNIAADTDTTTTPTALSLTPALIELFDEHAAPTHCCTSRFKASITPTEDGVASMRTQLALLQGQLRKAELAPDFNQETWGKVNALRHLIKEAAAAIEAAADANFAATKKLHILDLAMVEAKTSLAERDARAAAAGVKTDVGA